MSDEAVFPQPLAQATPTALWAWALSYVAVAILLMAPWILRRPSGHDPVEEESLLEPLQQQPDDKTPEDPPPATAGVPPSTEAEHGSGQPSMPSSTRSDIHTGDAASSSTRPATRLAQSEIAGGDRTSVATTSRLQKRGPASAIGVVTHSDPQIRRVIDFRTMRWKHQRPMGRVTTLRRSVRMERQQLQLVGSGGEEGSAASRSRASSRMSRPGGMASHRGMSDVASVILDEEFVEGEASFYRRKFNKRRRRGSSAPSVMPALSPDVLSPDDAADAFDPGQQPMSFPEFYESTDCCGRSSLFSPLGGLLDIAEPDYETKRILSIALPSTTAAITDPLFRIVVVAILTNLLGAVDTVAYVLVSFFFRIVTDLLSGAIADVEWAWVQSSFAMGGDDGFREVGRQIQMALWGQLIACAPFLIVLAIFMEDLMDWLLGSQMIALVAGDYAKIIVINSILHALSRSLFLVLHVTENARFLANVDITATVLSVIAISTYATVSDDPTLSNVGWIQVSIGIAKLLAKIGYVRYRGWMKSYAGGLVGTFVLCVRFTLGMATYSFFMTHTISRMWHQPTTSSSRRCRC